MVKAKRRDDGFTLIEMILVLALLGTALTVVFASVQVLTKSAATNMEESAAAHDLSYSMDLLSKTLMASKVLYANDYQVVVLTQTTGSAWQVSSITATTGVGPAATRGRLIWEKWGSNSMGTATVGTDHTAWVMSDRNVNLYAAPSIALFSYYRDATDAGLIAESGKSTSADISVSAFVGTLPGGYPATAIGRIRLHIASAFDAGVRDDTRDVTLRLGN